MNHPPPPRSKPRRELVAEIRARFIAPGYPPDVPDGSSGQDGAAFSGGGSGGGGASANWDVTDLGGAVDVGVDVDDAWPLALAVAVLIGSALAMLHVVYAAPVLLAEIALDAALVAGIYRKLRKQDARYWLGSAVRHTWKPAAIAAACLWITGTALQWAVPYARSIGDVVRALGS